METLESIKAKMAKEPKFGLFKCKGLLCYVAESGGHWNGYVFVPKGNRLNGCGYDDSELEGVSVHGGLTYAGGWHIEVGNEDTSRAFGFDTAHYDDAYVMDLYGKNEQVMGGSSGTYKSFSYVKLETIGLAEQLYSLSK